MSNNWPLVQGDIFKIGENSFEIELGPSDKPEVNASMCKLCNENEANILLIPCKHLSLCSECRDIINICPECRKYIESVIKVKK